MCESEEEDITNDVIKLGKVKVQPLAYQDDIGSLYFTIEMVRSQPKKLT